MEMQQVTAESLTKRSIDVINMELEIFENLLKNYLNVASKPVVSCDPDNKRFTPDYMQVPRLKFLLSLKKESYLSMKNIRQELMELIEQNNMLPYYQKLCKEFKWKVNKTLIEKMKNYINENLTEIADIEQHHGENNLHAWKTKLQFLLKIGDSEAAYALALTKANDSTLSTNNRLEAALTLFRVAYFNDCNVLGMQKAIEMAKKFIDSAEHKADWSGRNKFKAYDGLFGLAVRDYRRAALNLSDCISTFESYELTDFATIVKFTVIAVMMACSRRDIQQKIINCGLIMQELNCENQLYLREFVLSLNECRYGDFFKNLAIIEIVLKLEPLTYPHFRQYVRDMKLKAYTQMLESYSIVNLKRMAEIFGVTNDYIEDDISKFIASGNLINCRIDKVNNQILTHQAGVAYDRSVAYQNSIKKGDFLLNRIKRLARIIDS